MKIGARQIGPGHPPYLIAELGVNHDGSVERALGLVDDAARAGADAIKLQLFRTDLLLSRAAVLAAYQAHAGETDPIAMLRRLEMPAGRMGEVIARAHARGLHAIVTVFSVEQVEEAERVRGAGRGWDAYKTASPDIINRPLLEALQATGRPLIVSTGASTMEEVQRAVGWLGAAAREGRLALMQCVSCYPTPEDRAEIGGVRALRGVFAGAVGYSDHTPGVEAGAAAVRAGACLLEKHLTYSRSAAGPDHAASLEREGLGRYAELARRAAGAAPDAGAGDRGPCVKRVLDIERDVRAVARQSLTTRRALPRGHALERHDLTIKRPGTGIEPHRLEEALGRRLARAVEGDMPLTRDDLEGWAP